MKPKELIGNVAVHWRFQISEDSYLEDWVACDGIYIIDADDNRILASNSRSSVPDIYLGKEYIDDNWHYEGESPAGLNSTRNRIADEVNDGLFEQRRVFVESLQNTKMKMDNLTESTDIIGTLYYTPDNSKLKELSACIKSKAETIISNKDELSKIFAEGTKSNSICFSIYAPLKTDMLGTLQLYEGGDLDRKGNTIPLYKNDPSIMHDTIVERWSKRSSVLFLEKQNFKHIDSKTFTGDAKDRIIMTAIMAAVQKYNNEIMLMFDCGDVICGCVKLQLLDGFYAVYIPTDEEQQDYIVKHPENLIVFNNTTLYKIFIRLHQNGITRIPSLFMLYFMWEHNTYQHSFSQVDFSDNCVVSCLGITCFTRIENGELYLRRYVSGADKSLKSIFSIAKKYYCISDVESKRAIDSIRKNDYYILR